MWVRIGAVLGAAAMNVQLVRLKLIGTATPNPIVPPQEPSGAQVSVLLVCRTVQIPVPLAHQMILGTASLKLSVNQ